MKRLVFALLLGLASLGIISCTQEMEGTGLDSREQAGKLQKVSQHLVVQASLADEEPSTKTELDADGKFMWSPGDQINLIFNEGCGDVFTYNGNVPARFASFDGILHTSFGYDPENQTVSDYYFWGVYPYSQSNEVVVDNGVHLLHTSIPAEQITGENTWGPGQFVYIAQSSNLMLGFRNLCGGLMLHFTRDGIKEIRIKGNNNEILAGEVYVSTNNNVPKIESNGETTYTEISVKPFGTGTTAATFKKSTSTNTYYYYVALPPINFTNGFTITMLTETEQGVRTYSAREILRNAFVQYGQPVNNGVTFTPRPPEADQIVYYADKAIDLHWFNGGNSSAGPDVYEQTFSNGRGVISRVDHGAVTEIPNRAFIDMNDPQAVITNVLLPEGVTTIGDFAFAGTALTSVTLPDGVRSIGREAFAYCESLATVNLPNSVTDIYGLAFAHCTSLESIHIPKLLGIGYPNPFSGCTNLCSFTGPDASADGKFLGFSWDDPTNTRLYSCALGAFKNQELILPQVIKIGAEAFAGGEFTGTVTIPKTVTTIENKAFYGCSGVNEIVLEHRSYTNFNSNNIPALPALEEEAFHTAGSAPCSSIKVPGALLVASNARIYQQDDVWYGYRNQVVGYQADNEIWMSEDVQPHGLTVKGSETTSRLLTGMILPMGFDATNYSRFCVSVEPTVPFPSTFTLKPITVMVYNDDIVAVKDKAFNKDNALNSTDIAQVEYISLPHSVDYIGKEAFKDDIALVAFPSDGYNLSEIDDDAFSGCTAMTGTISIFHSEFVNGGIPRCGIGSRVFQGCVGIEEVTLYECAEIGGYAFAGCTSLQRVNLEGGSVDIIADHAFDGCVDLERVAPSAAGVGNGLYGDFVMIRRYAFNNTALEKVDCRARALDQFAFAGMNITSAYIIGTETYPTSVGQYAFNGCSDLTSVRIPYVDGDLGENVFSGCSSLMSVLLGVTSIPAEYFKDFTSLRTVRLPQATSLGQSAFQGCTNLQTVEIPLVTTLGDYCFAGQHKVTTLELPSVTTIGTGALGNGTRLSQVTIGPSISSLTNNLFTTYDSNQTKPASFNLTMQKSTPPNISDNTFRPMPVSASSSTATSPITVTLANQVTANSYANAWKAYDPFKTMINTLQINQHAIFLYAH